MPTYLYCVRSDVEAVPAGLNGIDGAAVHSIESAGLRAWVSPVPGSVTATVERIREHDAVCAAALVTGDTPLPIRFGQTFEDDAATSSAIASREAMLRKRLARIAGCVELRLVVTHGRERDVNAPDDHAAAAATRSDAEDTAMEGPGTAFLRRLARDGRADLGREVRCEEVRHSVKAVARSLVVEEQPCESARRMSFFPVLVRRADVEAFRSMVTHTLAAQRFDLSILGPFAPYSFAGDA